jgi:hypothetical protein
MRILLVLVLVAGALFAQPPTSNGSVPGWQSIVNSMLSQNPQAGTQMAEKSPEIKPAPMRVLPATTATVSAISDNTTAVSSCSVPLLQANIPSDVHFTMQMADPPANKADRMPIIVPAPACSESPR